MRPILLKGHSRSFTMLNDTAERIGTYVGHSGAVWACDARYHSEKLLTAAADATVKLWDVQKGDKLFSFSHTGPARSVNFSTGDKFSDKPAAVYVYELAADVTDQSAEPHGGRITGAYWTPLNKAIMTTGGDGTIKLFDPKTGELLESHDIHTGEITNVAFNKSKTLAITASKDNTAKLLDVDTMKVQPRTRR